MCEKQIKTKRSRAPNYTNEEKETLLNIVETYKNILENKKTDGVSINEKKETWIKISEQFNASTPNMVFRPVDSLKKYYEHLKEDLRKRAANTKTEIYKTGGGPMKIICKEDTDDLLLSIINNKSVFGLENAYDSDSVNNGKIVSSILTEKSTEKTREEEENDTEEEIAENQANDIEIIYESEAEDYEMAYNREEIVEETACNNAQKSEVSSLNWKKAESLKQPVHNILQENIQNTYGTTSARATPKKTTIKKPTKFQVNRRRPRAVVALTSSELGEKYNQLIDKKLELVQCFKKEHDLRMQSLELDIKLKKKQLSLLISKDSNEMLMESHIHF